MEERVQLVGGTFAIRAAPGGGTIVEISLPGGADR
jgi:signal transduction histidine kinase